MSTSAEPNDLQTRLKDSEDAIKKLNQTVNLLVGDPLKLAQVSHDYYLFNLAKRFLRANGYPHTSQFGRDFTDFYNAFGSNSSRDRWTIKLDLESGLRHVWVFWAEPNQEVNPDQLRNWLQRTTPEDHVYIVADLGLDMEAHSDRISYLNKYHNSRVLILTENNLHYNTN